jgi:hypothetical protein
MLNIIRIPASTVGVITLPLEHGTSSVTSWLELALLSEEQLTW